MYLTNVKNEQGSALIVTLAIMGMVFLLGIMAVNNSVSETDLSFNQVARDNSYYVAQAGARQAFMALKSDPTWNQGYAAESFGSGQFSVRVTDSTVNPALADTVLLTASGSVDGGRTNLEYWCVRGDFQPFKFAMFGKTMVDIKNSLVTDSYNSDSGNYHSTQMYEMGDVGSNNNISVDMGAYIGGDVSSAIAGGASVSWGATVTGTVEDDAPEQVFPDIPQEEFDWAEANSIAQTGISGTYSYHPGTGSFTASDTVVLQSGVYYFSDMTLMNSASLQLAPGAKVTIYVQNKIELMNSAEVNTLGNAGDLELFSRGDLILKNSGDIRAVFYCPEGKADMRNSGEFYGAVVADEIICHNSATFHYDRSLANIVHDGEGPFEVVAVREL